MQRTSRKRQRTVPVVVQTSSRRPIDKNLIYVSKIGTIVDTQLSTLLITSTFPCTITGVRWSLEFHVGSASSQIITWAIVRVKDGLSPSTIAQSDAGTMYEPEQELIAFGQVYVVDTDQGPGPNAAMIEGNTKSMRKLMGGDRIFFIVKGVTAGANASCTGTIQFFAKS